MNNRATFAADLGETSQRPVYTSLKNEGSVRLFPAATLRSCLMVFELFCPLRNFSSKSGAPKAAPRFNCSRSGPIVDHGPTFGGGDLVAEGRAWATSWAAATTAAATASAQAYPGATPGVSERPDPCSATWLDGAGRGRRYVGSRDLTHSRGARQDTAAARD